jgi:hypothetical protein
MIKKSISKLVGLKKVEFDLLVQSGQIILQPARLIPTHKTGDEMALTSIFLSTVRLVKEYRDSLFKEIKLSRAGRVHYYTEACFPDINKCRIDGLIIVVTKGVIADAAFFEMKNKVNKIDVTQIEGYLDIAKKLRVTKLITISNEFTSEPTTSPIKVKVPKTISLIHFSWTYLVTLGQLLLFKNDTNIDDEDQVEIMAEALHYFESPISGVSGYTQMKPGWKELAENIRAQKPMKSSDICVEEAVLSWYEEEKDMALLLSRKLGVLVKSTSRNPASVKNDIKRVLNDHQINGSLSIKNAVSDIKITSDFQRRIVSMSVKLVPPLDKGNKAKISWIIKQLDSCNKKNSEAYSKVENEIWVDTDIKFFKENIKVKLADIGSLNDLTADKIIQGYNIVLIRSFGSNFSSSKMFIQLIEQMILEYYELLVQHLYTWNRPAPSIVNETSSFITD